MFSTNPRAFNAIAVPSLLRRLGRTRVKANWNGLPDSRTKGRPFTSARKSADLRALVKGLPLVRESGKPFQFALTRVRPNLRNNDGTAMALNALGLVLNTRMHERVVYAETFAHGRTVLDTDPNSVAGREVAALWREIQERLEKGNS